jgi:hypothetical protein
LIKSVDRRDDIRRERQGQRFGSWFSALTFGAALPPALVALTVGFVIVWFFL